jgi:hypothetical protein
VIAIYFKSLYAMEEETEVRVEAAGTKVVGDNDKASR